MRNVTYTLLSLLLFFSVANAKQVDERKAKLVGYNFMASQIGPQKYSTLDDLSLIYKATNKNIDVLSSREDVLFYVFNSNSGGFIIVAGDDLVTPILGYSDESGYDPDNMSPSLAKWLEGYKAQIRTILANNTLVDATILQQWDDLIANASSNKSTNSVGPLLQTKWDQAPFYNALCPSNSVTGCVATGMAQVMKFWNYPTQGTGFHSYNEPDYGMLSANFGSTTYQWSSMPIIVSGTNNSVATLMYHVGVSVDMDYSPHASGAYVISDGSPVTHCAEYAFRNYFGYSEALQGIQKVNYTDSEWINLLKAEFNAGRPVLYAGSGTGGGHCFVADGYDDRDYIHMNWGWGGQSDGFFMINDLDPQSLGSGGGTGGFNSEQEAIIGLQPPSGNQSFNLGLYDDVTTTPGTISYGQAFNVSTNIANFGTNNFTGDIAAAIFNEDGSFIDFVQILSDVSIQAGYTFEDNLIFSSNGLLTMLPGVYSISMYYSANDNQWIAVDDGAYSNYDQVTVINQNSIALYSAMIVTPGNTLTQGQPANVNVNIINDGTTTFTGLYSVDLFNLDGTFVQTLGTMSEMEGLPPGYVYSEPYLDFSCAAITAPPGSYLLAIEHKRNNGEWELTGSSYFVNPISVKVVAQALQQDQYESNNTLNTAHTLTANYSNNNAVINTTGSNCHIGSDYDFYKIDLPSGYNYSLNPRLHDSYNSGNGNNYTLDALFSYSFNGTDWSTVFDDVMPANIQSAGGKTIYFHVATYYAGQTGTYILSIPITRSSTIGWEENDYDDSIQVYPNPANDNLTIDLRNFKGQLNQINLIGTQGNVVYSQSTNNPQMITIPVNEFSEGLYIVQLITSDGVMVRKVVVCVR